MGCICKTKPIICPIKTINPKLSFLTTKSKTKTKKLSLLLLLSTAMDLMIIFSLQSNKNLSKEPESLFIKPQLLTSKSSSKRMKEILRMIFQNKWWRISINCTLIAWFLIGNAVGLTVLNILMREKSWSSSFLKWFWTKVIWPCLAISA